MTVLVSRPSQPYAPQTVTVPFAVAAGTQRIKVTLTRESWPAGPVGSITVNRPDGTLEAAVSFSGGVIANHFPDGTSNTQTVSGLEVVPQVVGTYTAVLVISQTLTTAVLVERF